MLLDAEFLRTLELLRRRLSTDARSGGSGDLTGPRRGTSAEFREHRPYAPGDDLRRVDWMAFARTGEPVIKLYRTEEDAVLRLVLDGSASLGFGEPKKLDVARKLGAALVYLALAGAQRAELWVARRRDDANVGATPGVPRRGRRAFPTLCRELEALEASGKTDLSGAVDLVVQRARRPGLLVVVSDFFDAGDVETALRRARAAAHDVILLQVLDPSELEPTFEGDLVLEDSETGAEIAVTADPAAIDAYLARLDALSARLRSFARKHGAAYVRVRTTEDLEGAVRRVLSRSVD